MIHKHKGMRFTADSIEFQPYYPRWLVHVRIKHAVIDAETQKTIEIRRNSTRTPGEIWTEACKQLTNW